MFNTSARSLCGLLKCRGILLWQTRGRAISCFKIVFPEIVSSDLEENVSTVMCNVLCEQHEAVSACVRPPLNRDETRRSIRSCSSDAAKGRLQHLLIFVRHFTFLRSRKFSRHPGKTLREHCDIARPLSVCVLGQSDLLELERWHFWWKRGNLLLLLLVLQTRHHLRINVSTDFYS